MRLSWLSTSSPYNERSRNGLDGLLILLITTLRAADHKEVQRIAIWREERILINHLRGASILAERESDVHSSGALEGHLFIQEGGVKMARFGSAAHFVMGKMASLRVLSETESRSSM